MKKIVPETHPQGENPKHLIVQALDRVAVDTYGGRVSIEWDHETPVTPMGQLSFFIEFLKRTELFDEWISRCPLTFSSPNAP